MKIATADGANNSGERNRSSANRVRPAAGFANDASCPKAGDVTATQYTSGRTSHFRATVPPLPARRERGSGGEGIAPQICSAAITQTLIQTYSVVSASIAAASESMAM